MPKSATLAPGRECALRGSECVWDERVAVGSRLTGDGLRRVLRPIPPKGMSVAGFTLVLRCSLEGVAVTAGLEAPMAEGLVWANVMRRHIDSSDMRETQRLVVGV